MENGISSLSGKHQNTALVILGLLAGAVNGILGSGGGIILVPAFIALMKYPSKKAFATSVSVTLPLSAVTVAAGALGKSLPPLSEVLPYIIGGTVGGVLAGTLLKKLNSVWLRRIFGALLILGGVKTLL